MSNDEAIDSSWDVEKYRADHECEDHWKLKKLFMETHKKSFSEDDIVSLAAVFTNVQFMGCRYPRETMEQVNELAKDIIQDYEASRKNRLKRTFVGGAEAAQRKVKRI